MGLFSVFSCAGMEKLPSLSTTKSCCQLEADIHLIDSFSSTHLMPGSETVTNSNLLRFFDDEQRSSSRGRDKSQWIFLKLALRPFPTLDLRSQMWSEGGAWKERRTFCGIEVKVCYFYQHFTWYDSFSWNLSDRVVPCALILAWECEGKQKYITFQIFCPFRAFSLKSKQPGPTMNRSTVPLKIKQFV